MSRLSPLWIALASALATHATAAPPPGIWRCGSSYSDTPCEGGRHIDAEALPSAEQRRQRDEGTRRDLAAGERMQRERLENDARPRQSLVIGPPPREPSAAKSTTSVLKPDKKKKSARPKKSDGFIATYADPAGSPASKKK